MALTFTPHVVAFLSPPPGTAFLGTFYYVDDFYNYLSYAQQAEQGAFRFQNRVLLEEHPPALVNLEWWLVGRTSALLGGGRLLVAYRLFAALAAFGLLLAADLWLRRLGVGGGHRLPALVLVATGGGLGGLLFTFENRDLRECLDLFAGFFPFLGLLTNPHFVAGTTLLLFGLHLFDTARDARGRIAAIAVATVLALVRPYDLILLVLIRTAAVLVLDPPRRWLAALAPLAGLLPVVLYLYWVFYRNPAFAFYAETRYLFPDLSSFAPALGPALLLALPGVLRRAPDREAHRARVQLVAWTVFGLAVIFARPVHFSLQFLVGIGFPLLALGAFGLRRWAPRFTVAAVLVSSTSLLAAVRFVSEPRSLWLAPRSTLEIVEALRHSCRQGDILFAPPEIGLLAAGLSPCRAFVSHAVDPGYAQKLALIRTFADRGPAERASLLDAHRITHLALPGDAGEKPAAWLGESTRFRRHAVVGRGPDWSLYIRDRGPAAP